jgi:hypothetical protein
MRAILLNQLDALRRQTEGMAATSTNDVARAAFYASYLQALSSSAADSEGLTPQPTAAQREWLRSYDLAVCSGNPADLPRERPW